MVSDPASTSITDARIAARLIGRWMRKDLLGCVQIWVVLDASKPNDLYGH